jgi:hypothetical protein
VIRRIFCQVAIPASFTAKIKSPIVLHKADPFALHKIGSADRVFDHHIINLAGFRPRPPHRFMDSAAHPRFDGSVNDHGENNEN